MNAKEIKHHLIKHLVFEKRHLIAVTEGINLADVLTLNHARFAAEYEIKVSRSDLQGEGKAIKVAKLKMELFQQWEQEMKDLSRKVSDTKLSKHRDYLHDYKSKYSRRPFRPNRFYFVVPSELGLLATEIVSNTPYGVIEVKQNTWSNYPVFSTTVKSKYIHQEKIDDGDLFRMVKRVGVENIGFRDKLLLTV